MQQVRPSINFTEIEHLKPGQSPRFNIILRQGFELSDEALLDCKRQLESLAKPSVKVLTVRDQKPIRKDVARTLEILIDAPVKFDPKFLEYVLNVFAQTDTAALYSDFENADDHGIKIMKLPAWSPIRYESIDYLGPVIVFDSDKLHPNFDETSNQELVIQKCRNESKRISRLPRVAYTCEKWQGKRRCTTVQNKKPDSVSIIIPTRGISDEEGSLLERCTNSLSQQSVYSSVEVIFVVDSGFDSVVVQSSMGVLPSNWTSRLIEFTEPFNFSRKCNLGATQASGKVLVFLNDDVELLSHDAIANLSSWTMVDGVGAVGSQLQFSDGSIQHGGVTLENVKPRNSYLDQFPRVTDFGDLEIPHEVSGVTGACLAVKRAVINQARGWNEDLPNSYNDIDLCLRLNSMGFQSVVLNHLKIIHNESSSRNAEFDVRAFETLKQLWPDELRCERYLRSADANGEYEGPWGCQRANRSDFLGDSLGYARHLIATQGVSQFFKVVFRRLTGKTQRTLSITRKEYL